MPIRDTSRPVTATITRGTDVCPGSPSVPRVRRTSTKFRRWVVKAGSNVVCLGGPLLLRAWMQQVATLRRDFGVEVIWVTSGAIASAVERTAFRKPKRAMAEKQALAAIGQPMVMDLYNLALNASGLLGAQILLTYDDLANRERRQNFQNTVEQLLGWNVTPILNENDAVATQEIQFGDNDSLSAKVATVVKAERLVVLMDVDGYYDSDPKGNPEARLIPRLTRVDADTLKGVAQRAGSLRGSGGMYSKLRAAEEATKKGIPTFLVRGDAPSVLLDVARGKSVGTLVMAASK
jgi:glutamate 5-kinase